MFLKFCTFSRPSLPALLLFSYSGGKSDSILSIFSGTTFFQFQIFCLALAHDQSALESMGVCLRRKLFESLGDST